MDWNNTKTVFIITFLILNIFLGYKLIERKNESQLDVITQSTMADLLSEMEITYPKLPEIKATETHITAVNIPYEEKEVKKLASKQQIQVQEDGKLIAVLNEPFPLSNTVQPVEEIKQYISENVINGKDYMFWRSDIENNIYYFFQTFEGKPIYFNQKGMVIVHLNDKSELIGYEQTYLTVQLKEVKQNILQPLKVVEVLLDKQYLQYKGIVNKIELGYFNLPEIAGDVQVLAPTWHVIIGENHYFVDAIDGELLKIGQNWSGENGNAF